MWVLELKVILRRTTVSQRWELHNIPSSCMLIWYPSQTIIFINEMWLLESTVSIFVVFIFIFSSSFFARFKVVAMLTVVPSQRCWWRWLGSTERSRWTGRQMRSGWLLTSLLAEACPKYSTSGTCHSMRPLITTDINVYDTISLWMHKVCDWLWTPDSSSLRCYKTLDCSYPVISTKHNTTQ